ncbi:MAG TPA: glycine--tRNA ligase subunit beta [Thermodesulfobacteriota bacterium]|nr:glycine--tRNA ligase subunit beta [Thermodesulfobacteriota bacterium]
MEKELILEIGTEEIPAGFLQEAIKNLGNIAEREFKINLLNHKNINTFGTPRRLVLKVMGLSDKQEDQVSEILGPPKRIAFDESGAPTKAALGFAKAQGVDVKELTVVERERGEFVAVRRQIKGEKTQRVLKNLLPQIILSIPFRKSMRWGDGDTTFARPIRWILALYGGKTIPFKIEGVASGSKTRGHRIENPKPFRVSSWDEYINGLREKYVILDQEKRKEIIKGEILQLAKGLGGVPLEDEELLETVTHLVEYPLVLIGNFEREFLELPKEVLISVMKNHQKYFPVFSNSNSQRPTISDKTLLPHFIFVCGTPVKDPRTVIKGNERVIRARFRDAQFFFKEDTRTSLSEKLTKLRTMVFLSDLGTYYDKTERMESLTSSIGTRLGFQDSVKDLKRAAELSKADLATQMVFEFPELQGTMGKYYALISGEKEEIAKAIEEQYMPTSREGKLPETDFGSVLSIADKVDTISSCFILGLTPTGTSDPYALRRQAIGIINIILGKGFHLDLKDIFSASLKQIWNQLHEINPDLPSSPEDSFSSPVLTEIINFMVERFRNLTISEGFPQDVVDAVISAEGDDVGHDTVETLRKIEALAEFRKAPDFDSLAIAFKRVVNIVKGQPRDSVNQELLVEFTEKKLYQDYLHAKQEVKEKALKGDYSQALLQMKGLKEAIDNYFDKVLVMDKDEKIRQNRLSMLWEIRDLFFKVADFSKIST